MNDSKTIRTFIGIPLTGEAKKSILRFKENLERNITNQRAVKWEKSNNLHMTLQFLGDTEEDRIKDILQPPGNPV